MKASDVLIARSNEKGVITVEGIGRNDFVVIGCSVGSSASILQASHFQHGTNTASFSLEKGKQALLALRVTERQSKNGATLYYLLSASWTDGDKPHLDLENTWVPSSPDRLGQIYYHSGGGIRSGYGIMVEIDGVPYTSANGAEPSGKSKEDDGGLKGFRFVPNGGDLICRYLLGEVGADEVKRAALEVELEELASEQLAKALQKNDELQGELNNSQEAVEHIQKMYTDEKANLDKWMSVLISLLVRIEEEITTLQEKFFFGGARIRLLKKLYNEVPAEFKSQFTLHS